jgi:opacity protein-like surface antigen
MPGLNVKWFFLKDRFQPYALGGVNFGYTFVHDSTDPKFSGRQTDWAFRFGGGLNIFATEHVAFYIEGSYLWGVGDLWELDYAPVGAGIEYHF